MIRDWVFVEADFLREYGLDLSRELSRMTWRRFLILLRGLSPQSATVAASTSRVEIGPRGQRVTRVEGDRAAQTAFAALFGRSSPKQ